MYLPRSITDRIITHARAGAPDEVCGLLRGRGEVVKDWHPTRNVAADPRHDYEIAAEDLLVAFDWEILGDRLIAIYHSHPAGPAYPSAVDAWRATYPDSAYLICSLQEVSRPQLRAFYLRPQPCGDDLGPLRDLLPFRQTRPGLWSVHLARDQDLPRCLQKAMPAPAMALYVLHKPSLSPRSRAWRVVSVEAVPLNVDGGVSV